MQMVNKMLSAEGNIIRINFSKKMSIGISVAEICAFVSSLVFGLALYNKWITKLIINPDVLLIDNPYSGLDAENRNKIRMIIEGLCEEGKCIITAEV